MKMRFLLFFLLFNIFFFTDVVYSYEIDSNKTLKSFSYNDDFETLMNKIREDNYYKPSAENVSYILSLLSQNKECFNDINYSDTSWTGWEPIKHLERLKELTFAYIDENGKYYADKNIFEIIINGLNFWLNTKPASGNWWHNQIAVPQNIGLILIYLRTVQNKPICELESRLLTLMKENGSHPYEWTGANKTDIALHWIYRSCLSKNNNDLSLAINEIFSPLVYTDGEGIQYDNSYFQHKEQLYIGGYGEVFLDIVTKIAIYVKDTKYALKGEKLNILSKFMRETFYSVIRGKYMLFDVQGRSISRYNSSDKTRSSIFARRMLLLDPLHSEEYEAIIARIEGKKNACYKMRSFHTHYHIGDYTLHVRPKYTFDVRIVSNRTMRCEYGNNENLKTYFMSDGCTNIVKKGDEYNGIFPVWDWCKIPGITAPQLDTIPLASKPWWVKGISEFAGGVSDSIYGVTTYKYYDNHANIDMHAQKSWFFFDDEIVCLGSGISSNNGHEIMTTVNQCLMDGNTKFYSVSNKKNDIIKYGNVIKDDINWVIHNNTGYLFPKGGNVVISCNNQKGDWNEINRTNKKGIVEKDIFTLSLSHGINPNQASYAYIIIPSLEEKKMLQKASNNINIIENSNGIHAVSHNLLEIGQYVFFKEGSSTYKDFKITVDSPCALIVKQIGINNIKINVADPGQKGGKIKIKIISNKTGKEKDIIANFENLGINAGITKSYSVSL